MSDTARIRIIIVDDQSIIRDGLQFVLARQPDLDVCGTAEDGEAGVALAMQIKPDVVLMDIKMPRLDGIQATRKITAALPGPRVLVLTTYDQDDWVFECIRAGAQGFLLKDTKADALAEAVRAVQRGETRLDTRVAGKVLEEFRRISAHPAPAAPEPTRTTEKHAPDQLEALTEREAEILALIAEGRSNKDIAAALYISDGTVRNYVSTIMLKLHANNRTQLALKHAAVLGRKSGAV
jgi:DNA-binding NarL/FixJ family response regulator